MESTGPNLLILLHSGDYDQVHHGLSIALSALALGGKAKVLFTYWSLEYVKKNAETSRYLVDENDQRRAIIQKHLTGGHLQPIAKLIADVKELGGSSYVCASSMALLNVARNELLDTIEGTTGIVSFLAEAINGQILFI